ncbi:MAG: polyhydroxybutyrate depolymerase [Anaerolineales bacterium]|nr:polyhydroxybutyrate depolymerase [Anaerolineales bacterium]
MILNTSSKGHRSTENRLALLLIAIVLGATACAITAPFARNDDPLEPGDHEFSLDHEELTRTYIVHIPPQAEEGKALPLVLAFHGGAGNANGTKWYYLMDAIADRDGFIIVYPNGTGRFSEYLLTWNAGTCCGYAMENQVDDVSFVLALLDDISERTPIDQDRIYATGLSNGAMMAYRLAVEASDRIAAIAPVGGAMMVDEFAPTRPVPVMHVHSIDDHRALYAGGLGPPNPLTGVQVDHPHVEDSLNSWIVYNGCPQSPIIEPTIYGEQGTQDEGHSATKLIYGPCNEGSEVVIWKLTGAGHVWPGGRQNYLETILGPSTTIIDANEEIWSFFQQFSREQDS